MMLDKQFAFIIGAPRSGSTWLQAMLGAHPAICTTGELNIFHHYTGKLENTWQRQKNNGVFDHGLPLVWNDDRFYGFLREFLRSVYSEALKSKPKARVVLDKSGEYSYYIKHILKLLPNAKFIHLIRDGRDVAVSIKKASRHWAKSWATEDIGHAALIWKKHVEAARANYLPREHYLEVRYRDLIHHGPEELARIFRFLGIRANSLEIEAIYREHRFDKMKKNRKWPIG